MANYPTELDNAELLLSLLGSNWSEHYSGREQVATYLLGVARQEQQKEQQLQEAVDCLSRDRVPLHRTDLWAPLFLRASQRNQTDASLPVYGEGYLYGQNSPEVRYARPVATTRSVFPAPDGLLQSLLLCNRQTDPSRVLVHGLDYLLEPERQRLVFLRNPFDDPQLPQRTIHLPDGSTDQEILLWVFRGQFAATYLGEHWGYLLGVDHLPATQNLKDLVNALIDAAVLGSAELPIRKALAALTDTPIAKHTGEVVQAITRDGRHLLILTDHNAYCCHPEGAAVVAVGDVLHEGDFLDDTVRIHQFQRGQVPAELRAVELGRGWLAAGFVGGLTFENKDVPLVVESDGVYTRLSWELGGWDQDVRRFFDQLHARGLANPPTLAQLLDRRTNPAGEPTAANLPATINPLAFLVANVLRNHAFVVQLRAHQQGPGALPWSLARLLRRMLPPHTGMLLVTELAGEGETVTMDGPGDSQGPGFTESPTVYSAFERVGESVDLDSLVTEAPRLRYLETRC